jgi:hypothetical protein
VSLPNVTSSTPSRLLRQRGRWALEVTRLVPLDDKILEPRSQRLEGSDAILRHLRYSTDQSSLERGAAQLMRALRGDDDRAFVVMDGEWVPSGNVGGRPTSEAELKAHLSEVRAEVLLLRAAHQRLRDRVSRLEARLEHLDVRPRSVPPSNSSLRAELALGPAVEPAGPAPALFTELETEPAADQTRQSAGVVVERAPPSNPFRAAAAALAPADAPPANAMALPPVSRVISAIAELFGGDPGLAKTDAPLPDSTLELAALYAGRFVDDDGNDLGALLGELRLVAHIGGKLMGLPTTVIDEQARTGLLNEQVLAAMSEVVNTLSATINELPKNPHVRATPVEPFPPDRLYWIANARHSVVLAKSRVGTLWLLAR